MAEETPNHNLQLYSIGQEGWTHAPDMQALEEKVWILDTESNLSLYTPHEGAPYLATDTGEVYRGTGSGWDNIGTIDPDNGGSVDATLTITDDGVEIADDVEEVNAGDNLSATDDGDGVVTFDAASEGEASVRGERIEPEAVTQEDTQAPIEGHVVESYDGGLGHYLGGTEVIDTVAGDIVGDSMLRFDRAGHDHDTYLPYADPDVIETRRGETYRCHIRYNAADTDDGSQSSGFVVCGQLDAEDELDEGYALMIRQGGDALTLNNLPTVSDPLDEDDIDGGVDAGTVYRLEIDVDVTEVRGRLVDNGGSIVAEVSAEDEQFGAGVLGHRLRSSDETITADFGHITRRPLAANGTASGGDGSVEIEDSGTSEGSASTLDFDNNLNAGVSDGVATINATGGGGGGGTMGWINVVDDYGADNTGSNNAAGDIQQALDDAGPGGTVFLPGGTYLIEPTADSETGLLFEDQHEGVTMMGVGYSTELLADPSFSTSSGNVLIEHDRSATHERVNIRNLRLNGNDKTIYRGVYMRTEASYANCYHENIWAHSFESGGCFAVVGPSMWSNIFAWDTDDTGLAVRGGDSDEPDPDESFVVVNGLYTEGHGDNGFTLSKQNGIISNVYAANNESGVKTSNRSFAHTLTNAYLLHNTTEGYREVSGENASSRLDNVYAYGNGEEGFRFGTNHLTQVGSIYARNNGDWGVRNRSDGRVVIQSLVSENNGDDALRHGGNSMDIMHYAGDDEIDDATGNLWILRSNDTSHSSVEFPG